MTIYLLEIIGLGLILFLVATVWRETEISPGTATNARRYHITLEESEYISVLKSALERTRIKTRRRAAAKDHREVVPSCR